MKLFLVLAAAAPLWAQCSYTISPAQFNIAAGSGTGSVTGPTITVTSQTGCSWGATTNTSWLHIDFGQTGTGSGSVGWHADTNTFPASRTGALSIAGQSISVTQAGQTCSYTLNPQAPAASYSVAGAKDSFQVQTSCTWTPSPAQGWIQLPAGTGATTGNGTVNFTVISNGCATSRSGSINLLSGGASTGVQFPVTQSGASANFTFTPTAESFSAAAADDRITITTGAGCGWNVFSDVSWLTVTSTNNGSGNGAFTIHVVANTSVARSGNLHINNGAAVVLLPVNQAAPLPPTPSLVNIANAADYAQGAVSPGEIVSLFGANLGPSPAALLQVSADGLSILKTIGGVQVMFDSVAAAVTYASATQVNAVVPYEVAGNPQTKVQVTFNGMASNAIVLPVQPSTPAIFTLDSSGLGPGAILNQDLSVNTAKNPAAHGSVVVIFCTGGGVTDPASADASITAAPAPLLSLPYSVTIGGQNAVVQYAGGAPATVAGLTQINAVVPAGISPGSSVPVVVTIGGVPSPTGVTLAVQ